MFKEQNYSNNIAQQKQYDDSRHSAYDYTNTSHNPSKQSKTWLWSRPVLFPSKSFQNALYFQAFEIILMCFMQYFVIFPCAFNGSFRNWLQLMNCIPHLHIILSLQRWNNGCMTSVNAVKIRTQEKIFSSFPQCVLKSCCSCRIRGRTPGETQWRHSFSSPTQTLGNILAFRLKTRVVDPESLAFGVREFENLVSVQH